MSPGKTPEYGGGGGGVSPIKTLFVIYKKVKNLGHNVLLMHVLRPPSRTLLLNWGSRMGRNEVPLEIT